MGPKSWALIDEREAAESSHRELQTIIDALPSLAWCALPGGSHDFHNRKWLDFTGLSAEQSQGAGWISAIHPDDVSTVVAQVRANMEAGKSSEFEARVRRFDGIYRWFLFHLEPLRNDTHQIGNWLVTATDIENRKRSESLLKAEKRTLEMIADGANLSDVLNDLCAVIDAHSPPARSMICLMDQDDKHLLPGAGPHIPPSLKTAITPWATGPNRGSCGTAAFTKQRVIIPDISNDPRWPEEARALALRNGFCAVWSEPLISKTSEVLGTFCISYAEPRTPDTDDLDLIEAAGDIARIAIERARGRAELEKALAEIKLLKDQLFKENLALREEIDRSSMFEEIVGSSEALRKVLVQVSKVARTDSTVLILGETGTGKELIARAIHRKSNRAGRAFIRVNCAAIPPSLLASELFGHEKGAFTGALQRRVGRFEAADGGTLFLDEVGELPPETQIALLRVLQEQEFERVGSNQPVSVDVRVLAASNRNLTAAVSAGTFREDLFYRLNVVPIRLPSLRERVDDIPLLVEYLIVRYGKKFGRKFRTISEKTLNLFREYDWPGNVRELQNVVERAVLLSESTFAIDESWLKHESIKAVPIISFANVVADREKEMIENALAECRGRIAGPKGAAAKLGIPRQTLDSKIATLGIDKYRFKTARPTPAERIA